MKKPFIAGNWKMHKTGPEAVALAEELRKEVFQVLGRVDILVCPPFTALNLVSEALKGSSIDLGAQNIYWEEKGAFTGEVSASMLKEAGCGFVLIGHSERRKYFSETNQQVNRKVKAALLAGLFPIVCVGETLEEREAKKEKEIVSTQLKEGLFSLDENSLQKITIAYEPVWAIGTGKTATGRQAEEMHGFIRHWVKEKYSLPLSENLRILYGGSVNPENIRELISQNNIDGALVGGASLKAASFGAIVKNSV